MTPDHRDTIKRVRSIFPNNLYLGGSMALKKFFYNTEHITPNDMDLFYYGVRPFEKHVLLTLLDAMDFKLLKLGKSYDGNYEFKGQYWYLKLLDNTTGVPFDLMFIDLSNVVGDIFGNELACIQYAVNYSEELLALSRMSFSTDAINKIRKTSNVTLVKARNTKAHIEKCFDRCNKLDLRLKVL